MSTREILMLLLMVTAGFGFGVLIKKISPSPKIRFAIFVIFVIVMMGLKKIL